MHRLSIWCGIAAVCGLAGCEQPSVSAPATVPPKAADAKPEVTPAVVDDMEPDEAGDMPKVKVSLIDPSAFAAAVKLHAGKVVLVDCWATWCIPCVKAFPHTVEMSRKYADQDLVVMSLSFDETDEKTVTKVRRFLQKQEATFENFISELDLAKDGAEAFDIDGGALPNFKIYDRSGTLHKVLTGVPSHEELEAAVVDALKMN